MAAGNKRLALQLLGNYATKTSIRNALGLRSVRMDSLIKNTSLSSEQTKKSKDPHSSKLLLVEKHTLASFSPSMNVHAYWLIFDQSACVLVKLSILQLKNIFLAEGRSFFLTKNNNFDKSVYFQKSLYFLCTY